MENNWWLKNNIRLIQTNFRLRDARKNIDELVSFYEAMGANAVLLNTGGIYAFYPTKLDFETINPFLDNRDFIGKLVDKCHKKGIKVISRFDFSKIDGEVFKNHPEWGYVDGNGGNITYNGLYSTCINSEYQKEKSLEIIDEILNRYPVDGVFFNMFGFVTRDYSNNYHGICRCKNCIESFRHYSGFDLPESEDPNDPIYNKYEEFKEYVIDVRLKSIYDKVKSHGNHIAVCNYARHYVDIIMSETNTEIHRPYPIWEYMTSDNVSRVYGTYPDKTSGDISINASSIDYRFTGISPSFLEHRFSESLLSGGQLFWCIIGTPDDYKDKQNFGVVKQFYNMHKAKEKYFGKRKNLAEVLLLIPENRKAGSEIEYRGIFRVLKESHILFRTAYPTDVDISALEGIKLVICPGIPLYERIKQALEHMKIDCLWTNIGEMSDQDRNLLLKWMSCNGSYSSFDGKWHYAKTDNTRSNAHSDWVFLEGPIVTFEKNETVGLELISKGMFGPPELCFGNEETEKFLYTKGITGSAVGFAIGTLYEKYGFSQHGNLIKDLIVDRLKQPILETNATADIELGLSRIETGELLLSIASPVYFNGRSFQNTSEKKLSISLSGSWDMIDTISTLNLDTSFIKIKTNKDKTKIDIKELKGFLALVLKESIC